jgi:hypothetical protein
MSLRLRLPKQVGGAHSSKRGKKGYDRKRDKLAQQRDQLDLSFFIP